MTRTVALPHARRASCLALLVAAAWSTAAQAETGPYYIGARQTFTHDTNVDRMPEGRETSDIVSSTGVFAGVDQRISRQRLRADLSANINRYQDISRLNHTDGRASARLDWETVGNLFGDVQIAHSQSLFRDFATESEAGIKTIVKATDAAINARLGVVTAWTFEAGGYGSRTRYSGDEVTRNDLDYAGVRLGARYNPRSFLSAGIALRHAKGEYPQLGASGGFERDDVDLNVGWKPTGTSSFDGRVSHSRLDYDVRVASRSFTSWALTYNYRPGGRLALNASAIRDSNEGRDVSGAGGSIALPGIPTASDQTIANRVATTFALGAQYELTGKVRLGVDLRHTQRKLDNSILTEIGIGGLPPLTTFHAAEDRTNVMSLQGTWDVTRTIGVSCGYTRVKRSVSGDFATLTYPFSVNLTSCSAQIALQI